MRLTRSWAVWLVLLALALPGFASVGGLCCGSGQSERDCCPASDKNSMPEMDSSAMGAPDQLIAAGTAECGPVETVDSAEYILRGEQLLAQNLLPVRGGLFAVVGNSEVAIGSEEFAHLSKLDRRPPRLRDFDPLSVALRI